ncbi:PepSY-like domain-containing protein [Christiangramia salexigens]|uniref:Putative beta-lactamase-inhibitor-like PepSY-like domain-containing protein n=1 Tax=Christiangramia salexigens TaxID=1913577 RepID=A0A1L3J483_9FLAO|nr:PepSY-like domain-containing protein [Christiangramia salexigens]APG59920.1 hypothetical protein LPB144_05615 [Christiangramia salexigens]
MLRNQIKFSGLFLGLILLASCSDDDAAPVQEIDLNAKAFKADMHVRTSSLPQSILNYVTENYPNLTIREAEIEDNNNYEVELSNGLELIFDSNGNFLGIDDDDNDDFDDEHIAIADIPQKIKDFIAANFGQYTIEEAERENNGNYEIELSNDIELIFDSNGNFLGIAVDENEDEDEDGDVDINPSDLPQVIKDYISENYPDRTIIEAEIEEDGNYEVTLNNGVELEFDSEGNFLKADDNNGDDEEDD